MRIGFIGAGKVGCSLGKYLSDHNEIVGYVSRSMASAEAAARFTGSRAFDSMGELIDACETIFLTVPDGQIAATWQEVLFCGADLSGKNVAHCSGALSSEVFAGREAVGALGYSVHPLFAVASKFDTYQELAKAFFAIEGDDAHLTEMVALIRDEGNLVQVIDPAEKVRYHAAAVLASNQVVALYQLACNELERCGFSSENAEQALAPLFLGNAEHIAHDGVIASLTGPAERGDMQTIEKHLSCLDGQTREVYELLNETLLDIAGRKHGRK
ncbi:Rossmann-like and DUF2520 domain-containing protein [Anaerotardibacter muris]|uniref:Rossmann-like and DUF2520 domain-containing protein n=1 Tax=Anaerotardibacter muris TaxID=2941505 RepID=UPI00203B1B30|nr:Rossmann-like and DUF2520 domain-containing protein [Anaerotardibacter muris]